MKFSEICDFEMDVVDLGTELYEYDDDRRIQNYHICMITELNDDISKLLKNDRTVKDTSTRYTR